MNEHERGFEAGYSAAIHDARVEGSRAFAELRGERGYNGWTNYPTWACHLWVTNEPAPYDYVNGLASLARRTDLPRVTLADALKEWLRGRLEPASASLQSDLLGYSLDLVEWLELADAFLEE